MRYIQYEHVTQRSYRVALFEHACLAAVEPRFTMPRAQEMLLCSCSLPSISGDRTEIGSGWARRLKGLRQNYNNAIAASKNTTCWGSETVKQAGADIVKYTPKPRSGPEGPDLPVTAGFCVSTPFGAGAESAKLPIDELISGWG